MHRRSVLLADRHSPMLEAVRSLLDKRFDAVVMVADEQSVQEVIERLHPELVIVDASLPRQEGRNVIAVLRDRFPDLNLIALSAFNDKVVVDQLLASGALAVVQKSSAVTDLVPALETAVRRSTFLAPGIHNL